MNFRKQLFICTIVAITGIPQNIQAQDTKKDTELEIYIIDEIVVSATRTATTHKELASSVTVIGSDKIENSRHNLLSDLLRAIPALDIVQVGGTGGQTSVFMRGANSNHTLVLIDGIEALDPISPAKFFDFATLSPENIERIEVLKGPQGTLYGSDAIAGVISIFTKRGSGRPGLSLSSEAGSFGTFRNSISSQGGNGLFNYSLSFSRLNTDGISAASTSDGNNEKDGFKRNSLSTRLGFIPFENSSVDFFVRYLDAKSSIDNFGGIGGDDPNNTLNREELFVRGQVKFLLLESISEQTIGLSYTRFNRDNTNNFDEDHLESMGWSNSKGTLLKFDWQSNLYTHENNTVTFGVESENEIGSSDRLDVSTSGSFPSTFLEKNAQTTGLFVQDQFNTGDHFFSSAGIRYDKHDKFGSKVTFRIAPSLFITENLKIKSVYGTGFKSPSLFQLYSNFGDENLSAEDSKGMDIGLELYGLSNRLSAGATYFRNDFENLIDFDSGTFTYQNISEAKTEGLETFLNYIHFSGLELSISYTYTNTEDGNTGAPLIRRAKNKFNVSSSFRLSDKSQLNATLIGIGKRDDFDFSTFPANRVVLDRYLLVNLSASHMLSGNLQLFGSIDNLFDENYTVATGFDTYGIGTHGGIKVSF